MRRDASVITQQQLASMYSAGDSAIIDGFYTKTIGKGENKTGVMYLTVKVQPHREKYKDFDVVYRFSGHVKSSIAEQAAADSFATQLKNALQGHGISTVELVTRDMKRYV